MSPGEPRPEPRSAGVAATALVAAAQLTPLVGAPTLVVWPYVGPKTLFVGLVAAPLILLSLCVALATRGRVRPRASAITLTVVLFAASLVASTLASVDRHRSIHDDWERMLGTFHLLQFLALGLAAVGLVRTDGAWRVVWRTALLVSIAVFAAALWQKVDPEFLFSISGWRVSSTLNHPAFLGGYAATTACLSWLLFGRERGLFGRGVALVAGLLAVATTVATETRSSILALAAGAGVLVALTAATSPSRRVRRAALALAATGVLGGLALVPLLDLEEERLLLRHRVETGIATPDDETRLATLDRRWEWTGKVPGLRRFTRASVTRKTASTRLLTWRIAVEAGLERPVLGYGPCNYARAFERHYRPELLLHGRQETWFDQAHSAPLDAFATRGFPGLLTQLALFVVPIVVVWRARRRGAVDARFAVAATAVLVTHFVHLLFVFDGASSWLGLVVFLAFLDRATRPTDATVGRPGQRGSVLVAAALGGGLLLAAAWVVPEWRTMRATDEALDRLAAGQGRAAEAAFVRALEGDPPHADGARDMFAVGALRQAARMAGAPSPELDRVLAIAFDALKENRELHPDDVRVVVRRAELARELFARTGDASALPGVAAELAAAHERSPRRQEIVFLLAELGPAAGVPLDRLEPLLRGAAEAEPRLGEAWLRLALLLEVFGRGDEASAALEEGIAAGARFGGAEQAAVDAILSRKGR